MKNKMLVIASLMIAIMAAGLNSVSAFNLSYYANHSKLASGKWVKIRVTSTGINEITNAELKTFGFQNPDKVRLFGSGGNVLSEILATDTPDDLVQVPVLHSGDKILFYGTNGCNISVANNSVNVPSFVSELNPYSLYGYYFLTDSDYPELSITQESTSNIGYKVRDLGFGCSYHEKEISNVGQTGKLFLGEDFDLDHNLTIKMPMPGIVKDSSIVCTSAMACRSGGNTSFGIKINGDDLDYPYSSNVIYSCMNKYDYFKWSKTFGELTPTTYSDTANIDISLSSSQNITLAKLDYLTLSYVKKPSLLGELNQTNLYFGGIDNRTKIKITDSNDNALVWNVTDSQNPIQYKMDYVEDNGVYTGSWTMPIFVQWLPIIAFNPQREQYKVQLVGTVENQDLHAMDVPDMLIVTSHALRPYAQEIADMHKINDNMDVAVVEQEDIFNEFSSGCPDATAIRRIAKMLWDKDKKKFKYILLFGGGSYDNRDLNNNHSPNLLLTYQSNESNCETESYVTDDYFGFLNDFSGSSIPSEKLCVGIGRMPVNNELEARNAVDKLKEYVNNPDYKAWNNEALLIADEGESYLFSYHTEGVERLLNDSLDVKCHVNKIYIEDYVKDSKGVAKDANTVMQKMLKWGQSLVSFVGHGAPESLTFNAKLWLPTDVANTEFTNFPIFTLATCDVARFDSGARGIAESMFHKTNGGAISLLASSRTVYATENDALNRAFIRGLYTLNADGSYPTVGDAIKYGKLSFAGACLNKLNFLLLGDPAMRFYHPTHNVKIESIDGVEPSNAKICSLSKSVIKGYVAKSDGSKNSNFNGEATVTIYNPKHKFRDINMGAKYEKRTSYICNDKLCEYSVPVVNGEFTATCVIPKITIGVDSLSIVTAYAYNPEANIKYSTMVKDVVLRDANASTMIVDNMAPNIDAMFINDKSFKNGDQFSDTPRLYVEVSDDQALNMNEASIGGECKLILDNNVSYKNLFEGMTYSNDNKNATLAMNLVGLSYGKHTLEFRISDTSNNRSSAMITFYYVGDTNPYELRVDEYPAREKATFNLADSESRNYTQATINVLNSKGELIWTKRTASLPCEWNLTDKDGNRVAPGLYNYYGSFKGDNMEGASLIKKIIVVKQ